MKTIKAKLLRALGVRSAKPSTSAKYFWHHYNNI